MSFNQYISDVGALNAVRANFTEHCDFTYNMRSGGKIMPVDHDMVKYIAPLREHMRKHGGFIVGDVVKKAAAGTLGLNRTKTQVNTLNYYFTPTKPEDYEGLPFKIEHGSLVEGRPEVIAELNCVADTSSDETLIPNINIYVLRSKLMWPGGNALFVTSDDVAVIQIEDLSMADWKYTYSNFPMVIAASDREIEVTRDMTFCACKNVKLIMRNSDAKVTLVRSIVKIVGSCPIVVSFRSEVNFDHSTWTVVNVADDETPYTWVPKVRETDSRTVIPGTVPMVTPGKLTYICKPVLGEAGVMMKHYEKNWYRAFTKKIAEGTLTDKLFSDIQILFWGTAFLSRTGNVRFLLDSHRNGQKIISDVCLPRHERLIDAHKFRINEWDVEKDAAKILATCICIPTEVLGEIEKAVS
jgi:hypothetical protein